MCMCVYAHLCYCTWCLRSLREWEREKNLRWRKLRPSECGGYICEHKFLIRNMLIRLSLSVYSGFQAKEGSNYKSEIWTNLYQSVNKYVLPDQSANRITPKNVSPRKTSFTKIMLLILIPLHETWQGRTWLSTISYLLLFKVSFGTLPHLTLALFMFILLALPLCGFIFLCPCFC